MLSVIVHQDLQYSRYLWEYKAGEFAVNVDGAALEIDSSRGFNVANLDRRIYRGVDIKDLFEAWNPNLRDASYYAGLNNILRAIEFKCGLSYNTISDAEDKEKTATEIISSRQRSYGTVREIQRSLEVALQRLIEVMCELRGISYESIESVFDWGDSILVDKEVEKGMFMQEIAAGIRAPWEYRVRFMGETEEMAKKIMAEIEGEKEEERGLFDEEEDEKQDDEEEEQDDKKEEEAE